MSYRRVGITELAKEFGVNAGTISRALNKKPGVGEDLRRRIVERAQVLNYRPNNFARALLTNQTFSIGVVGGMEGTSFFDNPFWGQILSGVEIGAREAGYDLLIGSSNEAKRGAKAVLPYFMTHRRVDGIVALNVLPKEAFRIAREQKIPCVQIDFLGDRQYPSVMTDHVAGAYAATRHLLELGHKCLLYFGDPWAHPNFRSRLKGFLKAAQESGARAITPDRSEVPDLHAGLEGYRRLLLRILRQHPEITGILFQNDVVVVRAKTILLNEGIRIPRDLSLVGFDDIAIASETFPPLTTMRVAKSEMGRAAFDTLLAMIGVPPEKRPQGIVRTFPAELIVRGTTAEPRRGPLPVSPAG